MKWGFRRIVYIAISSQILLSFLSAPAFAAVDLSRKLPASERNIFILDISGSTNSDFLWRNSLRPSIIKRLSQPFGMPAIGGLTPQAPLDITVSVINSQSIDAPVFPIVTQADARRVWGLLTKIGENPSSLRLQQIIRDIFGDSGAYAKESRFLSRSTITPPVQGECEASMTNSFKQGQYMGDIDALKKMEASRTLCSLLISLGKHLDSVDNYFKQPNCGNSTSCSDIAGAILRTSYAAMEVNQIDKKSKMCVAIASDMLNNYPGMSPSSILNSRMVSLTAPSIGQAKEKGAEAAKAVGIKFPTGMKIKVSIMGQGSGSKPLPLEKNSMLSAYWQGFWEASGIGSSNQVRSLDQACSI